MKKTVLMIIALSLLIALCFGAPCAYAEEAVNEDYRESEAYKLVKNICERFPDRLAGLSTDEHGFVQEYFLAKIKEYSGLSAELLRFKIGEKYYFNIELKLDKPDTDKQIIIGAHYDSESEGANDNASGVAAALLIMQKLAANLNKLPCDVTFVLFDGEEAGLLGSYDYVGSMSQVEKENTLVMFNMDVIANGDNLYVWCENKRTDLANLILTNSHGITEKPYGKGASIMYDNYGYGYYETIQNSDHTPFRLSGIPTALFFSGTYGYAPLNYAESSDPNKQVMNTSRDTFENLDKNNQEKFVNRINAVVDAVCTTVLADGFVAVGENARSQLLNLGFWYNVWWPRLAILVLIIIAAVFLFLHYRKLQKKAIMGTAEIKTGTVLKTPDADDIFTFKD